MPKRKPSHQKRQSCTPAPRKTDSSTGLAATSSASAAPQSPHIVFYDNLVGDAKLVREYSELLLKIVNGEELKGMRYRLKQMSGHRIYTLSLKGKDRASRLLFGELRPDNKQRILVLFRLIEKHRYDRSPLRDKRLVKEFFINHDSDIKHATALSGTSSAAVSAPKTMWEDIDALPKNDALSWMPNTSGVTLKYFNGELFWLGEIDRQAIGFAELPMTLTGPSGSGKSSNALFIMERALTSRSPLDPDAPRFREIVYLTKNPRLAARHREMFENATVDVDNPDTRVYFETPDDWVRRMQPLIGEKPRMGDTAFFEWYKRFVQTLNRQQKTRHHKDDKKASHNALTPQTVRDEICIAAGYEREQYCNPGRHWTALEKNVVGDSKESLPHVYIWRVLEAWREHLETAGAHDPAVCPHECRTTDSTLLIVDEAPDLSWLQLKELLLATPDMSVVFCAGPLQNLDGDISCIPYLLKLPEILTKGARRMHHINLPHTHRLPPNLLPLANLSIAIAHHFGGASFSGEFASVRAAPCQTTRIGDSWWLDNPSPDTWQRLVETSKSAQCIVVTQKEWLADARERFKDALVLLPEEAKGLQADAVILYRFLETKLTAAMSRALPEVFQAPSENARETVNRAHIAARDTRFNRLNNSLFTAITRARQNLVFVNLNANAPRLSERLKAECTRLTLDERDLCDTTPATDADWIVRILELADGGHLSRAETLYTQRFREARQNFNEFLATHRPLPPEPLPLEPVCSSSSSEVVHTSSMREHGIEKLLLDFKKRRHVIANALSRLSMDKNPAPLRQWLTGRDNLLPWLNINQLFNQIPIRQKPPVSLSLFGALCTSLSEDAHGLLNKLFSCNPGVVAALAAQLQERVTNPDSPFQTARADLMDLCQLGFTTNGHAALKLLTEATGIDAPALMGAARSHWPSGFADILKELRLLQHHEWKTVLSQHQKAGQSHYEHLQRIARSMREADRIPLDIWLQVIERDHTDLRERSLHFLEHMQHLGHARLQMDERETAAMQSACSLIKKLPNDCDRGSMANALATLIASSTMPVNGWTAATLACLRDVLGDELRFIKQLYLTPGPQWKSVLADCRNTALDKDIHLILRKRGNALRLIGDINSHKELALLTAREMLLWLFTRYAELYPEEDPLLTELRGLLNASSESLTYQEAIELFYIFLEDNRLALFSNLRTLIFEASEFCRACENSSPMLSRISRDESLRQKLRLFAPAASSSSRSPVETSSLMRMQQQIVQKMFTCQPESGVASLLNSLHATDSLTQVQRLMEKIPAFVQFLSFQQLCQQLNNAQYTRTSFLYWLCEEHNAERHKLFKTLLDSNAILFRALQDEIQKACVFKIYEAQHTDFMWMTRLATSETGKEIMNQFASRLNISIEKLILLLWNCQDEESLHLIQQCHRSPSSRWLTFIGQPHEAESISARKSMLLAFMYESNKVGKRIWETAAEFRRSDGTEEDLFDRMLACLIKLHDLPGGVSVVDMAKIPKWKVQLYKASCRTEADLRQTVLEWLNEPLDCMSPLAGLLRFVRDTLTEANDLAMDIIASSSSALSPPG
ncbi:hypothetical protein E3226_007920 [Legionella geestiana]|uniref:hypothetical protein n=1 Tax=Legionella geestiana TaxID=45065 RepID=UPI001091DA52|nr:hypothetical protein [Legionella geestiana]QDQ40327.1 hypothetical protein E3226_007920 [Legionella geestiana]